ncbi:MAG TPA: hypothetical protein VGE96_00695 [Steroidobacteraceae bacterium]|jgi:hypothetical protein
MWRTGLAFTALGFAWFAGAPVSATELPPSIAHCAEVADNLERLTCYDRLNPPRRAGAAPASAGADFGANEEIKRKREAAGDAAATAKGPDRITAKVTKVSADTAGQTLVELDNGQVWQQVQKRLEAIAAPGDEVTLTRGALGSYFLVSKSRLSTRVKRVK